MPDEKTDAPQLNKRDILDASAAHMSDRERMRYYQGRMRAYDVAAGLARATDASLGLSRALEALSREAQEAHGHACLALEQARAWDAEAEDLLHASQARLFSTKGAAPP